MRADRLLSLVFLLQAHGRLTVADLAARLEVSSRTVARDLEALGTAGVPLVAERGPGGGWRLLGGYRTSLTGLTTPEVQALFLAGNAGPLRDLGLGSTLERVFLKLLAAIPSLQRAAVDQALRRLHVDGVPWYGSVDAAPHLRVLQDAVWQDRLLRITYCRTDGSPFERVVEPYGLVVKGRIWYLIGRAEGEMRTYRVSRIDHAAMLDERFERQERFDLAAHWEASVNAFKAGVPTYPVTIRAAPDVLAALPRWLGRILTPAVEPDGPADERGWRTVSLAFDTIEEARAGVLQLGAGAEALAPPEFRRSMRETINRMAAQYDPARR